jgi:hypothetical protein
LSPKYYSQRQLRPYRGMLHVVDVGHALAYTVDGENWRARLRSREGSLWPVGSWTDADARFTPSDSAALMDAVNNRPPLPFRQADRTELWLLDHADGRPLALLQTRIGATVEGVPHPLWRPFVAGDADFEATCLHREATSNHAGSISHRDVLARHVNQAAGPRPVAHWFLRKADRSGCTLSMGRAAEGTSVDLPAHAFPEMLIAETWPDAEACALAREYHEWHAAALLTHLDLSVATRCRLEIAACRRPDKLLEIFRLIPEFVDRARLEIALVQARLMGTRATAEA